MVMESQHGQMFLMFEYFNPPVKMPSQYLSRKSRIRHRLNTTFMRKRLTNTRRFLVKIEILLKHFAKLLKKVFLHLRRLKRNLIQTLTQILLGVHIKVVVLLASRKVLESHLVLPFLEVVIGFEVLLSEAADQLHAFVEQVLLHIVKNKIQLKYHTKHITGR